MAAQRAQETAALADARETGLLGSRGGNLKVSDWAPTAGDTRVENGDQI